MPSLIDLMLAGNKQNQRPWPRVVVKPDVWNFAVSQLALNRWTLFGLWGEPSAVHIAILDEAAPDIGVISLDCPNGRYPSVGKHHAPAIRLERSIRDLFGLEPEGALDMRPWLEWQKSERDQKWPTCPWVFHHYDKPIGSHVKGFVEACVKAGLPNLRAHDLRRSAFRNMEPLV